MSRLPRTASMTLVASAMTAAACLVAPSIGLADVQIDVPARYVGGATAPPLPLPGATRAPDTVGRPSASPVDVRDGCAGEAPSDCMFWDDRANIDPRDIVPVVEGGPLAPPIEIPPPEEEGDGSVTPAVDLTPVPVVPLDERPRRAAPAAPPPVSALERAFGRLVSPPAADWVPWQMPTLRWKTTKKADYYNVQVFRGARRVLNAWPTSNRLRVPEGVLRQGRVYVWVVWPGYGKRSQARFGAPVGRSVFQVTLRPRVVFRNPGGRSRQTLAEVRPHIPLGVMAFRVPKALKGIVPSRVRIDAHGRFLLPVTKRQAERLGARLLTRGPTPPVGLRR